MVSHYASSDFAFQTSPSVCFYMHRVGIAAATQALFCCFRANGSDYPAMLLVLNFVVWLVEKELAFDTAASVDRTLIFLHPALHILLLSHRQFAKVLDVT